MSKYRKQICSFCLIVLVAFCMVGCQDKAKGEQSVSVESDVEQQVETEISVEEDAVDVFEGEIEPSEGEELDLSEQFYITEISDEIFDRIYGKSFKENCTLSRDDLRYIHLLYVDFEGQTQEGEMIVNVHIAETVKEIFEELYNAGYEIEKVRLIDEYDADDESSMADNNSSAFNFRFISHTTTISKHGLGLAVDINPLYNPYIKMVDGRTNLEPANAGDYVDRSQSFPHKIDHEDLAFRLFTERGFEWGGDWSRAKDYQHFEIPSDQIREWYPDY